MSNDEALLRLGELRRAIDEIDVQILDLVNRRTRVVEEIGRIKQALTMPIYEPKREDEVFRNVTGNNGGPLSAEAVRRVFERIIDEMRTVQRERMIVERSLPEGGQ